MFLWPEGYNRQPQNPLKQLIEKTQGDILLLLEEDLFVKQAKLGDSLAVDTLVKGTTGLLEVMFMDYQFVLSEHFEQLTNQYAIMWELIDLKLERVNAQILVILLIQTQTHWEFVFQLLNNELTVEIQWYYALRIISFISQENPTLLERQQDKLIQLYRHLEYPYVAQLVIEMMVSLKNKYQESFLCKGIQEFDQLTELQAINFTQIIHELFTKIKKQDLIEFIITSQILTKMFEVIQLTNKIVAKNAAHIISIISNHYSTELQNLDLEEDESEQITSQFQSTLFYQVIKQNLHIINNLIKDHCDHNQKITQLIIKLIEIVDNLVRITDVSLWESMHQAQIFISIIRLCNVYPKSDILSSQVERIVFYIFERALNDYHPFWAFQFIKVYKIQNNTNSMFNRQVFAFEQELNAKITKELDYITYDTQILEINSELEQSKIWGRTKWELKVQQCENQKKLGSQMQINAEETKLIEINNINIQNVSLDTAEEKKGEDENKEEVQQMEVAQHNQEQQHEEEQKQNMNESDELKENTKEVDLAILSESDSSSSSNDSNEENQLKNDIQIKNETPILIVSTNVEYKNRKNRLNLDQIEKLRKKSIQFEKISQQMTQAGRRLSLQAGLNIKELSPTYLEFKLDLENKVLRNINDNSILKVDEMDSSINQ
ncbi:unnamed protein product (macronuclear) [Paramecium tetraurelia]|uniref:FPL domain-containing protein n=1 Tax=Paramecium tetraurelia TaxID=5888 RepID=A0BR62_PARTE|nr:uncharacterized protein GSPATT00031259001 [Paramecium tetraurelia]CAK61029.1 unnamed protein product [Paramecium tetraurelia]|eukprot:XP_001428427.1 hypothetical protein (macronuclear) [Paramecium tetraurelia strain d4-2]